MPEPEPSDSDSSSQSGSSSNTSSSSSKTSYNSTDSSSIPSKSSHQKRKKSRKHSINRTCDHDLYPPSDSEEYDKQYTSLFNKLCKAAAHQKLPKLRQEGKPEEMREITNTWIEGIQDVLCTNKRTNGILDDYPNVPTDLPPLVNDALGSFHPL